MLNLTSVLLFAAGVLVGYCLCMVAIVVGEREEQKNRAPIFEIRKPIQFDNIPKILPQKSQIIKRVKKDPIDEFLSEEKK